MIFAPLCRHVMSIINDYFEQFSHFKWQWMIKIGDDYSDYTNIEKNEFSNELAKLQLQFRWESEIERVGQEREHTKREREKGGGTLLTAAVGDFSGSTLLLHGGLFLQITVICHIRYVLRVLLDAQRFRVVCHLSTHEWRGVCVREREGA